MSFLLRLYEPETAERWLFGANPLLRNRRPIDLIRLGRTAELLGRAPPGAGRLVRVILYRCFASDERAGHAAPGGALWFPRELQGDGRHDAPDRYGCVYVSEEPVSALVEELARFAGTVLGATDLRRGRLPLGLAEVQLAEPALLVDLDSPLVLAERG